MYLQLHWLSQSNINMDVKSSSTPTMRSAVSAPRSAAGPIAAPRTTTAPAALRPTTGSTATTAPRKSTPASPALPADPRRIRCPLSRQFLQFQIPIYYKIND
ncbi:translation initiation factor IF-2-like [Bactrocera neohumeralis]|uniref:translation initiation factor IF-2-like n=1 Tax=Bactrocera neohumeralis TaxID=98809 RepID=UPI002164F28D|nr:translation initiation factor IF-2-like [Bactrocera neohumeralis]